MTHRVLNTPRTTTDPASELLAQQRMDVVKLHKKRMPPLEKALLGQKINRTAQQLRAGFRVLDGGLV
jgi:hypothetical protein